jgi:uncharacterized protein
MGLGAVPSSPVHTFTGRSLHLLAPTHDAISIHDIAHALSLQCLFAGQIGAFYSVAQHSVLCSQYCEPEDALAALLHDAAEAYMSDLPRPVKAIAGMDRFLACEQHLLTVILQRFGLSGRIPESVTRADNLLCLTEAQELFVVPPAWAAALDSLPHPMTRARINPWPPGYAEQRFLDRFAELGGHP